MFKIHITDFKAIPSFLFKFLYLNKLTFVSMEIRQDLADLKRDYGLQCRNVVELGSLAAAYRGASSLEAYHFVRMAEKVSIMSTLY